MGNWWRQIAPNEGEVGGDGVQDPMDVSMLDLKANPEVARLGSLEEGLVEIAGKEITNLGTPAILREWRRNAGAPSGVPCPAIDLTTGQGNLWVANEGTEHPLKMRDAGGSSTCSSLRGWTIDPRHNVCVSHPGADPGDGDVGRRGGSRGHGHGRDAGVASGDDGSD